MGINTWLRNLETACEPLKVLEQKDDVLNTCTGQGNGLEGERCEVKTLTRGLLLFEVFSHIFTFLEFDVNKNRGVLSDGTQVRQEFRLCFSIRHWRRGFVFSAEKTNYLVDTRKHPADSSERLL